MIKSVSVRNYQSLRKLDMKLGRVTVVVGHSDAGKSAFIRSIQAICYNQEGNEFIHRMKVGASVVISAPAAVALELEDGSLVTWQRFEKSHKFILLKPDGSKVEFEKTGGSVPSDLQDLLGIYPVQVEDTKKERIHFAMQHQLPFLVGDRGGVGANRVLGRLTGLHIFANAAKHCTAERDSIHRSADATRQVLEQARKQLAEMPDLASQKMKLDSLRVRFDALNQSRVKVNAMKSYLSMYQSLIGTVRNLQSQVSSKWDGIYSRLLLLDPKIERLHVLKYVWDRLGDAVTLFKRARANLISVPDIKISPSFNRYQILKAYEDKLGLLMDVVRDRKRKLELIELEFKACERIFREFEEKTPLCPWSAAVSGVPDKEKYLCPAMRVKS